MNVTIKHLKKIAKLSKKNRGQLRKLNPERAYNGRELTKYELIYQIVFLRDAPISDTFKFDTSAFSKSDEITLRCGVE